MLSTRCLIISDVKGPLPIGSEVWLCCNRHFYTFNMLKCLCATGGRIEIVIPFEIEESIDVLGRWHGVVLAEKKSVRALAVELVWLSGTLASFRKESIFEMFELKARHSRVAPTQAEKKIEAAFECTSNVN